MEIETTTEFCPVLENVQGCRKNPNHVGFYSVSDISVDILPEEWRSEEYVSFIQDYSKIVVRLTVKKNNNTLMYGTGFVFKYIDSDTLFIQTNHHVVGSQQDVENCKLDFFYDTADMKGIENSYGLNLESSVPEGDGCLFDRCLFTFHPVPEKVSQLLSESKVTIPISSNFDNLIVISHPHGGPKKITLGKNLTVLDDGNIHKFIHTAKTCPGSSGGAVLYEYDATQLIGYITMITSSTVQVKEVLCIMESQSKRVILTSLYLISGRLKCYFTSSFVRSRTMWTPC